MKYMTFNSSCSYAGLANLLSYYGVDTEDRDIALRMHLPYLFAREESRYLSGPMLQGAKWFGLYLRPLGFVLTETVLRREEAVLYLCSHSPAMLGLRISPESKHAVICTDCGECVYSFLNNKRRASPEPETLRLTEADLLARLDETVTTGVLEKTAPAPVNFRPHLENSLTTLRSLQAGIAAFCAQEQPPAAQREALDALFRPILLDGVTMLELIERPDLSAPLQALRGQLLPVVRRDRPAVLADSLDLPLLNASIAAYIKLIEAHIRTLFPEVSSSTGANL